MPTFKYDGKEVPFEPGDTIIRAVARQGKDIPHYCWHPGLSAPANCRMCLVEIMPAANQRAVMLDILQWDEKLGDYAPARKPKLQPSCQIPAAEGMDVKGDSSEHVVEARKGVQEFLLLNHPVDCPICDQSGECKLQDYWLEHGQYKKRMKDEPIHKPKAVQFGPTIVYDAERCVMCTRCIRFMDEVAQDPVLDMRERGGLNEIMVSPGRELDGHYTFMTEHVCPVGALTTKDFRFKARVWFLRSANSVCQGCATGCNAHLDYDPRTNTAYRYRPRDNEQVNKYWMCDEGMLSYKRAHEGRQTTALAKGKGTSVKDALAEVTKLFDSVMKESVAVVFSAEHSQEDNWALKELATLLGTKALFYTKAPDGYEDKILINKDKNSNTRGVTDLIPGVKTFGDLIAEVKAGRVRHAIALGSSTPSTDGEADIQELRGLSTLVVLSAREGGMTRAANVVLPACSWAEASGTYVNAKGIQQISDRALDPIGSSRPAWDLLADVARALGYEPNWAKLKDVRARFPTPHSPLVTISGATSDQPL